MPKTTKLTPNELAALKAIDDSEYGDSLGDEIWSFTIADNSDMPKRSVPGVVASLQKKGLVVTSDCNDMDTVRMTDAGIAAYVAAVGTPRKRFSDADVVGTRRKRFS